MNEADLYSLQRRKFKMQNLEENIKTMNNKQNKSSSLPTTLAYENENNLCRTCAAGIHSGAAGL